MASDPAKDDEKAVAQDAPKRDVRFWMVFVALCFTVLLSALDLVRTLLSTTIYQP